MISLLSSKKDEFSKIEVYSKILGDVLIQSAVRLRVLLLEIFSNILPKDNAFVHLLTNITFGVIITSILRALSKIGFYLFIIVAISLGLIALFNPISDRATILQINKYLQLVWVAYRKILYSLLGLNTIEVIPPLREKKRYFKFFRFSKKGL